MTEQNTLIRQSSAEQRRIHFIGICGVAMSALALAFHKKGWKVTGSDKGFYPPVSTHLKEAGIPYYPGWHPEKMGTPDHVVIGNVAGSTNPEWLHVQKQNIPYSSYPEIVAEYFVKDNSIVCAGTYGKTTMTTLLAWILTQANMDPTYMFGGLSQNNLDPATISDSSWSILEGDEYKSSRWDNGAKFFHYKPTHLLLSAVAWDHADVYPTEKLYFDAFSKLVSSIPTSGVIVANIDNPGVVVILKNSNVPTLTYGSSDTADVRFSNINQTADGTTFTVSYKEENYLVSTNMIGDYMAQNITGCFAMAVQIGIEPKTVLSAISSFQGVRRRLEKRRTSPAVIDDIAHSPDKARAVLKTLRQVYGGTITAVFEPNTGNRKQESFAAYDHAFADADRVIIPRLTAVKVAADDTSPPCDGKMLTGIIKRTHNQASYIPDDHELVHTLTENAQPEDCFVFLGSHGFRGMIEETVTTLTVHD